MASHCPSTTGESFKFSRIYVTVASGSSCGFALITGGSRETNLLTTQVDCTAPFTAGMAERKKVAYGTFCSAACLHILTNKSVLLLVRLGSSGLKFSEIILGCMSYGSPEWRNWVLPEEESIKHIKAA